MKIKALPDHYLIFKIGKKEYGISVDQVLEVVKPEPVTKLPYGASFLEGIMSLRGHSIAILNLRQCLNLPAAETPEASSVILVKNKDFIIGLKVDKAVDVFEVPRSEIDAADKLGGGGMLGDLFAGVAHSHQKEIVLLNLENILNERQRAVLEHPAV